MDVGSSIARFREQKGITVTMLARATSICVGDLLAIQKGRKSPTIEELERIAKVIGVPPFLILLEADTDLAAHDSIMLFEVKEMSNFLFLKS